MIKINTPNRPLKPSRYKKASQMSLVLAALLSLVSISVQAQQSATQCQFTALRLCAPASGVSDFHGAGDYEKGDPGCGSAKEITLSYYPLAMHSGIAVLDKIGDFEKKMMKVSKLRDYRFIHNGDRFLTTLKPSTPSGDVELIIIRQSKPQLVELWAGSCTAMDVDEEIFAKKLETMAK